jgi:hypothetical protein
LSVVTECSEDTSYDTRLGLIITYGICWYIGEILLLVVFVWVLNTVLRQRLGGRHQTLFQTISWVVLGIVAVIGATFIAINSYNTWARTQGGYYVDPETDDLRITARNILLAYRVLYLAGALTGGILALLSLFRLRPQARVSVGFLVLSHATHI